jgi:uroporphyrinogen decarboxylase
VINSKQLTEQAIAGEIRGPVPVGVVLGGSWPVIREGYTLEELIGDAGKTAAIFHQVNERLDADILTVGTGATALLIRALGGKIRFHRNGAPEILSGPVWTQHDVGRLNLASAFRDPAVRWLGEVSARLAELVADRRFILASGRAPFTLAGQIFGLENFLRALYKNPALAHELLAFTTELSIAYFRLMNGTKALPGALVADPTTSGDVISRKCFEKFALPYLKKVIQAVKEDYGYAVLHICGDITDRLPLLEGIGIDVLSIDSKVSITAAKNMIGRSVCIAGNVDPVGVLEDGQPDQVATATRDCLEAGTGDGRFILLPGCDLAAAVQEANIKAMIKAAHDWPGRHNGK